MPQLQQNFNSVGVWLFLQVLKDHKPWAIPHFSVPNISQVDWTALHSLGIRGCVFDKDNTLTVPYAESVDPRVAESFKACREVFDGRLVLFSNSAGLDQYDPDGSKAKLLEQQLGVPVLRHKEKKPGGGCGELEQYFGCPAHQLVMVGDRYLTDIVFGNRHGMLTVRSEPLLTEGEPPGVVLARAVEDAFVARWLGKGIKAPAHPLVSSEGVLSQCIKK